MIICNLIYSSLVIEPNQGSCATIGHCFDLISNPSLANFFLDFLHTGSKYPTLDFSAKVHLHGQRGSSATQLSKRFLVNGWSSQPGNNQLAMLMAPLDPLVSDQQTSSSPLRGPSLTTKPRVLADCAIGIMIAKRSTNLEPSCLSSCQPVESTNSRNALIHSTGVGETSKSKVALFTMADAVVNSASINRMTILKNRHHLTRIKLVLLS